MGLLQIPIAFMADSSLGTYIIYIYNIIIYLDHHLISHSLVNFTVEMIISVNSEVVGTIGGRSYSWSQHYLVVISVMILLKTNHPVG